MAHYTGETVHVVPVQHFQPQYGYPQASVQQHAWPPPYFQAHSYQKPASANTKDSHQPYSQRPNTQIRPQIQPDPLPPHSKPQDLSPNQSLAFAGPMPCKPIHLGKEDVFYKDSCMPLLAISKEAVHMPSFLSSKPLLTITRCDTNARLGTIRFHMTSSDIELNVNGRDLVLSSSRLHNRWMFQPTSLPTSTEKSQPWYWRREKLRSRSVILVDNKKRGNTMARIDGNVLSFEKVDLGNETLDEIIMTAVALAEHARRQTKNAEVVDLSSSIADLAGGHGTLHSGSSHHHHSGHSSGGGGGLFFGGTSGGDGGGGSSSGCGDGGGGGGGGGGGDGGGGGGGC